MRRVFLFSVLIAMCVNAAYATDISSSATTAQCVEPTLHRYEGTANLQAQWEANTVSLRWYNNNTMIPSTDAIDDCQYAGSLTTPTNPTRTGYTFTGWTVRPLYNFSSINTSTNGTERWAKGASNYCWHDNAPTISDSVQEPCTNAAYTELNQHEWKVHFSYGDVYGMAHCTAKPGNNYSYTWPTANRSEYVATLDEMNTYDTQHSTEEKIYCWCQATGFTPINTSVKQGPLSSLAWVFHSVYEFASACASGCATSCARSVRGISAFRAAVLASDD